MKIVSRLIKEGQPVLEDAEYLFELHKDRLKLEAIEKFTRSVSNLVYLMTLGIFFYGCILLVSLALGIIVYQLTLAWVPALISAIGLYVIASVLFIVIGKRKIQDAIVAATIDALYAE